LAQAAGRPVAADLAARPPRFHLAFHRGGGKVGGDRPDAEWLKHRGCRRARDQGWGRV